MSQTEKAKDEVRSAESEDKESRSMGIGMLKDKGVVFVRKFRWTLKTEELLEHFMKEVRINFRERTVSFKCYEVLLGDEADDIPIQKWLEMPDHKDETLVFTTYDSSGQTMYEYRFEDIEVVSDEAGFDYADSDASYREVTLTWKRYERLLPQKNVRSRWPK